MANRQENEDEELYTGVNGEFKPKHILDGVPFTVRASDVYVDVALKIRKTSFKPTDVILSGHPRSGNTWTLAIVWLIMNDGDVEAFKSKSQLERACRLDNVQPDGSVLIDNLDKYADPRVLFSHAPYKFLAPNFAKTNNKVIYCLRNPKDMMVSFWQASKTFLKADCMNSLGYLPDLNQTLRMVSSPSMDRGSIFQQVSDWWEHRDDPNIYFSYYEDTVSDPEGCIRKLAKFLEKDLTDEQVKAIAEATSIGTMKTIYETHSKMAGAVYFSRSGVVRQGGAGGWKKHFTVAQNEWFDRQIEKHWGNSGLKFRYE